MEQRIHFRARRAFEPLVNLLEEEIIPRNINAECPRAVLAKKEEIALKRLLEAGAIALANDVEFEFALKVVDGQWLLETAVRKTRRLQRRRRAEAARQKAANAATGAVNGSSNGVRRRRKIHDRSSRAG